MSSAQGRIGDASHNKHACHSNIIAGKILMDAKLLNENIHIYVNINVKHIHTYLHTHTHTHIHTHTYTHTHTRTL